MFADDLLYISDLTESQENVSLRKGAQKVQWGKLLMKKNYLHKEVPDQTKPYTKIAIRM